MNTTQTWTKKSGFTLLELLIVITILAILTLVVVLFINPVEMLKKSRDVQRMSDLATTQSAIVLFLQDKTSNTLGGNNAGLAATIAKPCWNSGSATAASSTQWLSIYSTGETFTYGYASSSQTDYIKNNGLGWVPVNFASVAASSSPPIAKLPIDPTNTKSGSLYYRYACVSSGISDSITGGGNNTFELDATLESDAYKATGTDDKPAKDGGNSSTRYEVGTSLNILPATAE